MYRLPSMMARATSSRSMALPRGRRDVLVAPEQVRRVVAGLDLPEPVPRRPGVGFADPRLAVETQEVDVRAVVLLLEAAGEALDPRTVHLDLLGRS
jgi:hypothetical protein